MEYCPLGSVRKLVGLVNGLLVARLIREIGNALLPCHEREGFHRDIKPDNILMSEESGRVIFKLSDFGLAQDNNTSSIFTQGPAGTLGYIAPEIIAGGQYTSMADIYSLGITARELLTGVIHRTDPLGGKLATLEMLIRRMTHPEPERRLNISDVISLAGNAEIRLSRSQPETGAAPQ